MTESITLPDSVRAAWPYEPRRARVNGWRMHYVDEGAGDPVVLLHGNPTWGFLWREVIPPLVRAGYRVIVPDMIGFGLSEKPTREQAHSLDGHIANLTALLPAWTLQRLTMVCHDWGGPTGLGFALSQSRAGPRVGGDEQLGLGDAAGRISTRACFPGDDARAAGRPLSARPPQRAGAARGLSVRRRPRRAFARGRRPLTRRCCPMP